MTVKTRSYHQYCPVAHLLDCVGDRWALLIVRDLLVGPKRFVDLRTSLTGIVTNTLTDRLRELEAAGIVQRRYLPPPAASMVYELTPDGQALEPVLIAMAQWGARSLGTPQADQTISTESVRWALAGIFRPVLESGIQLLVAVDWDDPRFTARYAVHTDHAGIAVTPVEAASGTPRCSMDVATVFALASGQTSLADAVAQGMVQVEGSASLLTHLSKSAVRSQAENDADE